MWLIALAIIGVALAATLTRKSEPTYQGRSLSELIDLSDPYFGTRDPQKREAAVAGVHTIGTNAIPFLLHWIQHEEPIWKTDLRDGLKRITGKPLISEHKLYLANNAAIHAFATLGPSADAAIDDLARLMSQTNNLEVAGRAAVALCYTARSNALPPLLNVLTNETNPLRHDVAESIHLLGTNAIPAIPALIARLQDVDEMVAKSAAWSLGELKLQPQFVVPALMASAKPGRPIVTGFALSALGEYGTNATLAIPLLVRSLESTNAVIRKSATNALESIAPEVLTNDPPH